MYTGFDGNGFLTCECMNNLRSNWAQLKMGHIFTPWGVVWF